VWAPHATYMVHFGAHTPARRRRPRPWSTASDAGLPVSAVRGPGRLDEPAVAGDVPRLRAGPELRVSWRRRDRPTCQVRPADDVDAEPVGALRGVDHRKRRERAERTRWTHRLPFPRARRPSRHACARRARAVPRAPRRRGTGRSSRVRRRRAGSRNGHRTAALSAGSRARADRRPHLRDRLHGSRRGGLRVHVRPARFGRGRLR
jgi:hypothetical protein